MKEVEIRLAIESDVVQILEIYVPFIRNGVTSFELNVPTIDEFWQRIDKIHQESPWLVCCIDGQVAGYAYACGHRSREAYLRSRELSVYVSGEYRKRGIAKALYESVIDIIKHQGFTNVLAGIVIPNEKSIAFHTKMGFKQVGIYEKVGYKFGKFHSVAWYQLFIGNEQEVLPLKPLQEQMEEASTKSFLQQQANSINLN